MIRKILIFLIASTLSLHTSLEAAERSFAIIIEALKVVYSDAATKPELKAEVEQSLNRLSKKLHRSFLQVPL